MERIALIKLASKLEQNKEYADKIGVSVQYKNIGACTEASSKKDKLVN